MQFVKEWDAKAIDAVKKAGGEKAVLTGYPHDAKAYDLEETSVPMLCESSWNKDGLPQFKAIIRKKEDFNGKALPVPFTSGGFIFAPSSILKEVPYDPNLPHLFQGEEILYSARAWTHGYNFFTAPVNIVLHKYYREKEPKFWQDVTTWQAGQKQSASRARKILGLEKPGIAAGSDPHGLGTQRTIEAYWSFAGLDPKAKTSRSKQLFCGG